MFYRLKVRLWQANIYLRKKERQQVEIFFAWLNDGLMKSLLELSNRVFVACDEIKKKRHFNARVYATR